MHISSTNIGQSKTVSWRGKPVQTGIFKAPSTEAIFLGASDVEGDTVIDRKYHGGTDKACYLYPAAHYPHWQQLYPNLDWQFGMFGENLTVDGIDEQDFCVGNNYKIGAAIVQVSQPRQPCFKLGIRFGTQAVLKQFINSSFCGAYLRVLQEGTVAKGDAIELLESDPAHLSIATVYRLMYHASDEKQLIDQALAHQLLPEGAKASIRQVQGLAQ